MQTSSGESHYQGWRAFDYEGSQWQLFDSRHWLTAMVTVNRQFQDVLI